MGDWIETELGFVNFDQIMLFRVEPSLPEPDAVTFSGKPKGIPAAAQGVSYDVRAVFADGEERDVWSFMGWQAAWNLQNSWREMLQKRSKAGSAAGYGVAVSF